MPDNSKKKAFQIESTDVVSAYNRLPLDTPVTFGIKLGFVNDLSDDDLKTMQQKIGLRISIYLTNGEKKIIPGVDFLPPISRKEDEFFFETKVPKAKEIKTSLLSNEKSGGKNNREAGELSNFILVEFLRKENDGVSDVNAVETEAGAKETEAPSSGEEVLRSDLYYIGDQPPSQALQSGQRNLIDSVQNIGDSLADGQMDVNVLSPTSPKSPLLVLFKNILDTTRQIGFDKYQEYIDRLFCAGAREDINTPIQQLSTRRVLPFNDTDSYRILKIATEAFLMSNVGCCNPTGNESDDALEQHFGKRNIHFPTGDKDSFNALWKEYITPDPLVNGDPEDLQVLPYLYIIRRKFKELGIKKNWVDQVIETTLCDTFGSTTNVNQVEQTCIGIIQQRLRCPLYLELIWSYWQEEGMLVQTMNAISQRFQNVRGPGKIDPLAEMEVTHLMPLNNIIWGYIQDEQHRLSLRRRTYEYDHHYGISLEGKAVPKLRSADSRSLFIEGFHNLLHLTAQYYKDVTNKLVEPDPYPILNALREVHFIISEGMHNQYGALPSTARQEMLIQQWILARPEFRQFLPGRAAVPYTEPWMDRVASMNKLQAWTKVSPMHFNYLATYGEQLLLSIRYANWSDEDRLSSDASLWAKYWRAQVQGYIHSYKVATGVDLGATNTVVSGKLDTRPPSYHLARRLKGQSNGNGTMNTKKRRVSANGKNKKVVK